jgi:two-component system, NtrC family, sensor histidine kinase HydH
MTFRIAMQPRFIVGATALLAVLMVGSAVFELRQSRDELYHLLREEAVSIAETIDRGGTNAMLSMARIEDLLAERLLHDALTVAHLDSLGPLRQRDLAAYARANRLFRINIFDHKGNKLMSAHTAAPDHAALPEKRSPAEVLAPILSGAVDRLVIGMKEARLEEGQRFAVAVRRANPAGGAIVVNIDAAELLEFRRAIGIGKLIRDLGDSSGIRYVALQDSEGIIAASSSVRELTSFAEDSVLQGVLSTRATTTRVAVFDNLEVYEVLRIFAPGGTPVGVLRIALSMDEVRHAETRMIRRMIIVSLVVIVIGALAFVFLMAQQSYRAIEKKYTSIKTFAGNILTQMRDGVVTVDPDEKITIFNASAGELFGASPDDVEGHRLQDLQAGACAGLTDIFAQPDGTSEVEIHRADGTHKITAVSLSTTRDSAGAPESRSAVLRDLTETRRLEREAQRKEKLSAMGELASGVAHEIRNPLNAIAMIAQRLEKEFRPRNGVTEYRGLAKVMQQEAQRVNAIIKQFLSFARPARLQRREVEVAMLVGHVASLFSAQAVDKGVSFQATTKGGHAGFLDAEQLKQALLNILQNALEATPPGGRIILNASTTEGRTRFTVSDTGNGIPRAMLDKIFNLYFTTKPDGTGVGLSMTQQIVAQHGGSIDVATTEGKGTIFTIDLPDNSPP